MSRQSTTPDGVRMNGRSSLPAGWRAEDLLRLGRPRHDEFLPALEAAARMNLTLAEVEGLAQEGWLDWQARGGDLWVRPVVLSRLRVVDELVHVEPGPGPVEPAASTEDQDAGWLDDFGSAA